MRRRMAYTRLLHASIRAAEKRWQKQSLDEWKVCHKHGVWRCLNYTHSKEPKEGALNGRQVRRNGRKRLLNSVPEPKPPFVLLERVLLLALQLRLLWFGLFGDSVNLSWAFRLTHKSPAASMFNALNGYYLSKWTCTKQRVRSGSALFSLKREYSLFSLPEWGKMMIPLSEKQFLSNRENKGRFLLPPGS